MKTLESLDREMETLQKVPSKDKKNHQKKLVIGRELTKVFEEIVTGTPAELIVFFANNPDKVRGEFVVICYSR